ncbi:MAG: hypothetical protein ACK5HL_00165 [Bacilli bacterium]
MKKDLFGKTTNFIVIGSLLFFIIYGLVGNLITHVNNTSPVLPIETIIIFILSICIYLYFENVFKNKITAFSKNYFYVAILFGYASIFLGTFMHFYSKFIWWDDALHFSSGILLGFMSIVAVASIIRKNYGKIKTKDQIIITIVMGVLISLSFGVFWEFYEYSYDYLADEDSQRSIYFKNKETCYEDLKPHLRDSGRLSAPSLNDTMNDMLNAFFGALISAFIANIYLRKQLLIKK